MQHKYDLTKLPTPFSNNEVIGSASYLESDVLISLEPTCLSDVDTEGDHCLAGNKYLLANKRKPTCEIQQQAYTQTLAESALRIADDVQALALYLATNSANKPSVIISFVNSSLPFGVLLTRAVNEIDDRFTHYSVSMLEGKGVDMVALNLIASYYSCFGLPHSTNTFLFAVASTGGGIVDELHRSLAADPEFDSPYRVIALSDPSGQAWLAASSEDRLMPSCAMGPAANGLLSQAVWQGDGRMHGCVSLGELELSDVSLSFIESVQAARHKIINKHPALPWVKDEVAQLALHSASVIDRISLEMKIEDISRIKSGVSEATRAALHSVPVRIMVQDRRDTFVPLLDHLAKQAGIEVEVASDLGPYLAITVIE